MLPSSLCITANIAAFLLSILLGSLENWTKFPLDTCKSVFQITFKGSVPARSFEGSIDVVLPTPYQVSHLFCPVRWPVFLGF